MKEQLELYPQIIFQENDKTKTQNQYEAQNLIPKL